MSSVETTMATATIALKPKIGKQRTRHAKSFKLQTNISYPKVCPLKPAKPISNSPLTI